jgi:hypothetical protein
VLCLKSVEYAAATTRSINTNPAARWVLGTWVKSWPEDDTFGCGTTAE